MSLFLDIAAGETIIIGGNATIKLEYKTGSKARLSIDAPKDISVELQGINRRRHPDRGALAHKSQTDKSVK